MLRTGVMEDGADRDIFRGLRGGPARPSTTHWLGGPEARLYADNDLSPISLRLPIDMKLINVGAVQAPSGHSTPSSRDQFLGCQLSSPQFPASPQFPTSPRYQSPISRHLSSHERFAAAPRMSPEHPKAGRPSSPVTLPASPNTLRLPASPKRVYALGSHGGPFPGGMEDRSPMQLQTPSDWGTPLPSTMPCASRNPAMVKHLNQHISDNTWMRTSGYSPQMGSAIPLGMLSSWEQHQQHQEAMANERKIQRQMEQQIPTYDGHAGYESIGVLTHHDFGNASIEDDDSQRHLLGRRHSQHAGLMSKGVRQGLRTKVERTKGGIGRENGVAVQYGSDGSHPVVRLRGLPFAATESEIMKFFGTHGINIVRSIEILKKSDGRPSGQARVTLDGTDEDAYSVQDSLQWQWMGNRYIEVFVEGDDDRTLINKKPNSNALNRQPFGAEQGRVQNGIGAPQRGENTDPLYGKQPLMGHTGMPPTPQGVGSISMSPAHAAVVGNHPIAQVDAAQKNWNNEGMGIF
eukprot:GEMP01026889.1.p1 GENE.GEMP01026889.1~~GEMP01026889.1.p1  ORF type:complete len:518 (+),score=92.05 GEMP01026889.1:37-1590(+)